MIVDFNFDEIRPYHDHEANPAVKRLVQNPSFINFVQYILPQWDEEKIAQLPGQIHSIKEFQKIFTAAVIQAIIAKSTAGISHSGLSNINKDEKYLFITNHRDILMDSALLNFMLHQHGFDTTEVAIGDNLLITPLIDDLAKLNRNFVVNRNVSNKQLHYYSLRLSAYIHTTLLDKKTSVWIAQREGRTKNGDDRTQPGLLKMLGMHGTGNFQETFEALNIVPVAIAYEIEPCDLLKAIEIYKKGEDINFTKTPQDDLNSMLNGVIQQKGKVHFAFGNPIKEELDLINKIRKKNEQIKELGICIDGQIHQNYKLSTSNYVAYDQVMATREFEGHYTPEEKEHFLLYISKLQKEAQIDELAIRQILLDMYAYPVKNKVKVNASNSL